ncbi:MAG: aminopeptidase P family protein [Solirubrobacterales bacterium]|nr:aminopeptidase P family protein [Solirubrobacterales bacterium]
MADRADRLSDLVAEAGLDSLLVAELTNLRYISGFAGSNGACLIGPDTRTFFTDFRYTERAAEEVEGFEVEIVSGDWLAGLAGFFEGKVGFEDDHLTVRTALKLEDSASESAELIHSGGLVESLRRVKEPGEIERIATAAELTDSLYHEVMERGLTDRTEAEIGAFVVARMREVGGEPSFPPIVASGPNGASPHAEPGPRVVGKRELVTIDMGATLDGYCSDCTRTFATGMLEAMANESYEVTLAANEAGLKAVQPGAVASDVDAAARDLIEDAGYGEYFGHGLGHGVGLEVHEGPRLGARSKDVLATMEVVTVEPGIYISGFTGVRIEDLVVVGEEGIARNLSSVSKALTYID